MVLPVHDRNPVRRTPVVTYALIAINVLVFLAGPVSGVGEAGQNTTQLACRQSRYYDTYGAIPRELLTNKPLPVAERPALTVPTNHGDVTCAPADERHKIPILSALLSLFVHGGWLHLLGNMLFLYVFGNNVEDRMGRTRFALFYLAAGMAATYGFALADPTSTQPLIGASGAISAVLGAYLFLFPRARVTSLVLLVIPLRLPAWFVLGSYFILQWLYFQGIGVSGAADVAYSAHLVGFVCGFGYAWVRYRRRGNDDEAPGISSGVPLFPPESPPESPPGTPPESSPEGLPL